MRYTESKERSAEWLRAALGHMGQHDAAFNPLAFAVWYEYAAGINARLTRAIDECRVAEPRIGDATIARLYRDHVNEADEEALQRASGDFQRVMSGAAESAARTGDKAGAFGIQLTELTRALHANEKSALGPVLSGVLEETTEMENAAQALQQQLSVNRDEIERLRDDLSRARDEALIDPLTRLANRKGFDEQLQAMLARARGPGASGCIVMLDIDSFKAVNDTCGHVMGDRVLQAVAEVLRSGVSGPAQCAARYGGEEFAILLPDCALEVGVARAESSRRRVAAMKVRDRRAQNVIIAVTISAGVTAMRPTDDATGLIARADDALYSAKRAGRDRVHCV